MKGLGHRIRTLRKARKLTLVEIAEKTGIDQATLSRLENEKMTGTLDSHMRIADALGVRLPDLYDHIINKVHEAKERIIRQKISTFSHSSGAVSELLTTGILQKKMMPVLLKIKSKGYTESEEYQAGTERFVFVLKGDAEVIIGREKRLLRDRESLYFNAALAHHFRNGGKSESWMLSVLTPSSL